MLESIRNQLLVRAPVRVVDSMARQAAVALILAPVARGSLELLLIKRAARPGDPWSGQMALPGGRRDDDEVDLLETAIRETSEETDVRLKRSACLGALDDLHPSTSVLPNIMVRPFVFTLDARPVVKPNPEVAAFFWTDLECLADTVGMAAVRIDGTERSVEAMWVDDNVVWGMTYRIIKPFLDLVHFGV